MNKFRSNTLHLFALLVLVSSTLMLSQQAVAESMDRGGNGAAMVGDLLFARPLGFIATVMGTAVFVVTVPFTLLGGNFSEAANELVIAPAKFTFVRPLGK